MALVFLFVEKDLNLKKATSVKKSCLWQVFSEVGAQSGTKTRRVWVDKHGRLQRNVHPVTPTILKAFNNAVCRILRLLFFCSKNTVDHMLSHSQICKRQL